MSLQADDDDFITPGLLAERMLHPDFKRQLAEYIRDWDWSHEDQDLGPFLKLFGYNISPGVSALLKAHFELLVTVVCENLPPRKATPHADKSESDFLG